MKTHPVSLSRGLLSSLFAGFALALIAHAGPAGEASPGPKTHTLFLGADIDLQQPKGFARVENVTGQAFVIKVDGKDKSIPMRFTTLNMKVDHELKLSESSITVGKLVVERGYTSANDPNVKFVQSMAASAADAQLSIDTTRMTALMLAASRARNNPSSPLGGPVSMITGLGDFPDPDINVQVEQAQRSYLASAQMIGSDINNAGNGARVLMRELGDEMFDALEISFTVSSDKPFNSPYAVVLAQFAARGAKPSEVQNWVYATELDPINSEVRKVQIRQGGFPPGFELKSYQLHLYNRGQEVATTVAPKRVELTREEAFDYVLIDYLASNKGKTLPPTVALGRLSGTVRATLPKSLYIKVSKDGLPVAAYADEACTNKIDDAAVDAALRDLRFKPALEHGQPVSGVARLGST